MKIYSAHHKKEEKILRTTSVEVNLKKINSKKIQNIVQELFDYSKTQSDSAGISAVQLGYLQRVFIVEPKVFDPKKTGIQIKKKDCVFINPKIIKNSKKTRDFEEGCLSVRGLYGTVARFKNISIEYYNLQGEKITRGAGGILSIIFQHEIDHLDGILFIDKAKNIRKLNKQEIKDIRNNRNK